MKNASEMQESIALMEWAALLKIPRTKYKISDLLFHLANEGKRTSFGGHMMVKMGLKKGLPDYLFACPQFTNDEVIHLGMFIEMKHRYLKKSTSGGLSIDQKKMLTLLDAVGYKCIVAYGWEEARDAILEYLK